MCQFPPQVINKCQRGTATYHTPWSKWVCLTTALAAAAAAGAGSHLQGPENDSLSNSQDRADSSRSVTEVKEDSTPGDYGVTYESEEEDCE